MNLEICCLAVKCNYPHKVGVDTLESPSQLQISSCQVDSHPDNKSNSLAELYDTLIENEG